MSINSRHQIFRDFKRFNHQSTQTSPTADQPLGFEHFAQKSSVHGLRFLSKGQNSNFSRIFWSLFLILSLIGLFFNARRLYIKLNISPDIAISVTHDLAREVPFPAITVCVPLFARNGLANYSYFMDEYRLNGNKNFLNLSESESKFLATNSLRCALNRLNPIRECCQNTSISNLMELMYESSASIDDTFASCSLRLGMRDCQQMFTKTLTDRGFCLTTNMQRFETIWKTNQLSSEYKLHMQKIQQNFTSNWDNSVNWTLDNGYISSAHKDGIPVRLTKSNVHTIRIKSTFEDIKNTCNQKNIIIKAHLPNEIATMFHRGFHLEHSHEKRLILGVKSTKAHSSLKSYAPEARGCFFSHEKELQFFKIYTKHHCYLECLTNYVLEKCGCVAFFMPRNSSMRACDLNGAMCLHKSINDWPSDDDLVDGTTPCECYPTCNNIEYTAYSYDNEYDPFPHAGLIKNFSQDLIYSRLYINFDDHVIQVHEQYVSYKLQNFIADIGGLLGLFLGCSLLSMIEVVYFVCNAIQDRYFIKKFKNDSNIQKVAPKIDDVLVSQLDQIGDDIYIVRSPLYKRNNM